MTKELQRVYILKTWDGEKYVAWTAGANPSNINKLIDLHSIMYPGRPFVVDKAR